MDQKVKKERRSVNLRGRNEKVKEREIEKDEVTATGLTHTKIVSPSSHFIHMISHSLYLFVTNKGSFNLNSPEL